MEKTMANGGGGRIKQNHVIVFPFPRHGHMSPMLQFSKRLISKGLLLTFLVTSSASQSLTINIPPSPSFMISQFSHLENVKWIFINTFDRLESKVVNWMAKTLPIKTVGPTIPSAYLDGRLENDKAYGLNVSKSNNGKSPIKWLDSKETASVIYISFGSLVMLSEEQVKELTNLLRDTDFSFLWVLRESELVKLPNNFVQDTSDRGLIVNWCCQLQVLSHKAVSCFVTHCGWNSTLEALSLGVPIVAIPQWVDQTTNAKLVADVWRVGVRVEKNEKGVAIKEELEASIRKIVVQGNRPNEFKQNSIKWKNLAKEAVDERGSSDKNIEEFVQALVASN